MKCVFFSTVSKAHAYTASETLEDEGASKRRKNRFYQPKKSDLHALWKRCASLNVWVCSVIFLFLVFCALGTLYVSRRFFMPLQDFCSVHCNRRTYWSWYASLVNSLVFYCTSGNEILVTFIRVTLSSRPQCGVALIRFLSLHQLTNNIFVHPNYVQFGENHFHMYLIRIQMNKLQRS